MRIKFVRTAKMCYICRPKTPKLFYTIDMYAIVEIAGQQFKVEKDRFIYVNRLAGEAGDEVSMDKVLLLADGENIQVGAPTVAGATVTGKLMEHVRADKVVVFKKIRRKGYQKRNGHRQDMTKILIEGINA